MKHGLNEVETRGGMIDPVLAPLGWGSSYHFVAFVLFYTLMNNFLFRSINTLFILCRDTPAMPLVEAQIGGFFYARRIKVRSLNQCGVTVD